VDFGLVSRVPSCLNPSRSSRSELSTTGPGFKRVFILPIIFLIISSFFGLSFSLFSISYILFFLSSLFLLLFLSFLKLKRNQS